MSTRTIARVPPSSGARSAVTSAAQRFLRTDRAARPYTRPLLTCGFISRDDIAWATSVRAWSGGAVIAHSTVRVMAMAPESSATGRERERDRGMTISYVLVVG